jgi:hypothetical protein
VNMSQHRLTQMSPAVPPPSATGTKITNTMPEDFINPAVWNGKRKQSDQNAEISDETASIRVGGVSRRIGVMTRREYFLDPALIGPLSRQPLFVATKDNL